MTDVDLKVHVMWKCAVCLHKPPGDRDITEALPAVTVMAGFAVCEEHIEWFALPDGVEDDLIMKRSVK